MESLYKKFSHPINRILWGGQSRIAEAMRVGKLPTVLKLAPPILVFSLALFIYGLYGFDGNLSRDEGIFLYAGQRMAEGVPPYVSIIHFQGPLGTMLVGLGVALSHLWGGDDIYTVRLFFFILGCFTAAAIYLLSQHLFRSRRIGIFSTLVFLGFAPFANSATSGPQTKTAIVLFVVLCLLFTSEGRWFWAGIFGSLAALTWQPTAIFPFISLFLAMNNPLLRKREAVLRTAAGIGLPVVLAFAYFGYLGSLYPLLEGSILGLVFYSKQSIASFFPHLVNSTRVVFSNYQTMFIPILIGIVTVGTFYPWRKSFCGSLRDALTKDRFSALLLSFPAPILWSLLDFQSSPDFFVFLPYISIGFGYFLEIAAQRGGDSAAKYLGIGLCIALFGTSFISSSSFSERLTLVEQRSAAQALLNHFGDHAKFATIGAPELMALLHRTNPTRYLYVTGRVGDIIQATTPGGFAGWLEQLGEYNPDVVVFGRTDPLIYREMVEQWLTTRYQEVGELNTEWWRVFALRWRDE